MERMIQANRDHNHINNQRFYVQVWLKYGSKVKRPEEIFEYMIQNNIGTSFASTFEFICQHYEYEELDFKRADKILRVGMQMLIGNEKEQKNMSAIYSRFSARMSERIKEELAPKIQKISKGLCR
mmetsp:Transcript_16135/g.11648  ORF Transcript_16135/g.11648 Transcript_16135/m.11648 type:complete len:125 (+) Transcript_16135:145-519(+)